MRKTKVLIATLVASVMLIGAGFASWTDALNINNTVKTGNLKVEFDKPICGAISWGDNVGENYLCVNSSVTAKKLTVTAKNMYPGAIFGVLSAVKNTGTMPAVFDNAAVNFTASTPDAEELKNTLEVPFFAAVILDENNKEVEVYSLGQCQLSGLQELLNEKLAGIRLDPGQTCRLSCCDPESNKLLDYYEIEMPLGEKGEYQNLQNDTLKFDIQLNWRQHNAE